MKIRISPPLIVARVFPPAPRQPAGRDPRNLNHDPLDLARQRIFGTKGSGAKFESEVDEAAIALVELSVLVYGSLDTIGATLANLRDSTLGLFGKKGNREADLRWLEREPELAEFVRNLSEGIRQASADHASLPSRQPGTKTARSAEEVLLGAVSRFRTPKNLCDDPAEPEPTSRFLPANGGAATDAVAEKIKRNRAPHALAITCGDAALISFRGTADIADWLLDFCAWPALRWPVRHWGFEKRWESLRPQIETWLEAQTKRTGRRPTLYIGGHSLGGAIATLAAADLALRYDVARVVTIGSPRPGDLFFRAGYRCLPAAADASGRCRTLGDVTTRFVHGMDAITFVPPWPIFQHPGAASRLEAKDRVPLDDYFSVGAMKPPPNGAMGQVGTGSQLDGAMPSWNWRYLALQCARYASTILPDTWGMRIFASLAPILCEGLARSFLHHKSARYLEFFPATEVRRAMAGAAKEGKSSAQT